MSSLPILSSVLHLKSLNAAVSQNTDIGNDYKAIVCVFLSGGNDSFNMLTPWTSTYHKKYLEARQHLALEKTELLPIPTESSNNMALLGVHGNMPLLEDMYRGGEAAFLANVGTLLRPTTLADVQNNRDLPKGLYSHREQQISWQTSVPDNDTAKGWIGRMSELINDVDSSNTDVSLNVSLSGSARILSGNDSSPFVVGTSGANTFGSYANRADIKAAYDTTLEHQYEHVIESHYSHKFKEIIDKNQFYNDSVSDTGDPFPSDLFPNTSLGNQLKQVALSINARDSFGAKRQAFFVNKGGMDHHGNLLVSHAAAMKELDDALHAFNEAMKIIGMHDSVVSYTASDFGRTISSNSSGADHAWGGNQIIMGGPVNGRKVYGEYPSDLRDGASNLDTGRGRFIPTTAVDELHAELALWYGVGTSDLSTILPNIGNFNYSPMGLLQI